MPRSYALNNLTKKRKLTNLNRLTNKKQVNLKILLIAALTSQIKELRKAAKSTTTHATKTSHVELAGSYADAVNGNRNAYKGMRGYYGGRGKNRGRGGRISGRGEQLCVSGGSTQNKRKDNQHMRKAENGETRNGGTSERAVQREVVSGVRRIWGTLRSSSHFCVKNTIVKLINVENVDRIQVKRKYKTTRMGKPKWWYVIHAEEDSILKPLEAKWESVQTQTGWHLEVCTKPVEAKPSNHDNGDVSVLSNSTIISCNQGTSDVLSPNIVNTGTTSPDSESDSFLDPSFQENQPQI